MRDVKDQLREYWPAVVADYPDPDLESIVRTDVGVEELVSPNGAPIPVELGKVERRSAPWRFAAAAAVVVLLVVGGVAWLLGSGTGPDVIGPPDQPSTTVDTPTTAAPATAPPTTAPASQSETPVETTVAPIPVGSDWDIAIRLPDLVFPLGPRESFDDFIAHASTWEGIELVVIRTGSREDWMEAVGEDAVGEICDPDCDQGIVLIAESDTDLEAVYRDQLFGWWSTPPELVYLSPAGADQWQQRTAARIDYLASYIASVSGKPGPPPNFDTGQLGVEQKLEPLTDETTDGTLAVRIQGTAVTAKLSYPLLSAFESIDPWLEPKEITLRGSSPSTSLSGGSAVDGYLSRIPTDPNQGLGVDIVQDIGWEGGVAFGIAGLPADSSVVAAELDGVRLWQTPVSGIAYFTIEGSYSELGIAQRPPAFIVYDSDGNTLLINR